MVASLGTKLRLALFCLTPLTILVLLGEGTVRCFHLDEAGLRTVPLPLEREDILRPDPELFWSFRPHVDAVIRGMRVTTNSLGLRGPEIEPKRKAEYRIVSLGESTTFGEGVQGDETYSAKLERELRALVPSRPITVINAGVPAYSSFQSLMYLELRGLALQPDAVLFYHEVNDYLPSSLRDSSSNEIGVAKTDKQLHESRLRSLNRWLLSVSAVYRLVRHRLAYRQFERFGRQDFENPLMNIGLPDVGILPRLRRIEGGSVVYTQTDERALGRRVSDAERREILERLVELCRREGIDLLVIHPSYRRSRPHECVLTRFAREAGLELFDAHASLHPPGVPIERRFLDDWHPTRGGHRRLGRALARALAPHLAR